MGSPPSSRLPHGENGPTIVSGGILHGEVHWFARGLNLQMYRPPGLGHVGNIRDLVHASPTTAPCLSAKGYSATWCGAHREVGNRSQADAVVAGMHMDIAGAVGLRKPVVRVHHCYRDHRSPGLMVHVNGGLACIR